MMNSEQIAILCQLSRGAFTDERIFRIKLAEEGTYTGACPRQYCYTREGKLLKTEQPEKGKQVSGLILARRVADPGEGSVLVSVPDGEVLAVMAEEIRPAPKEVSPDVSLQS